jgi:hypothetical protein
MKTESVNLHLSEEATEALGLGEEVKVLDLHGDEITDRTMADLRREKREIETRIGDMLDKFSSAYRVKITGIDVSMTFIGGRPAFYHARLEMEL